MFFRTQGDKQSLSQGPEKAAKDIDLGPSIHAGHRILEVVMPGNQDVQPFRVEWFRGCGGVRCPFFCVFLLLLRNIVYI